MSTWTQHALGRVFNGWLMVLPIAVYGVGIIILAVNHIHLGFDLHVFYDAARSISHGHSLYDPSGLAHLHASASHDLDSASLRSSWAVYPPVTYELLIPFGYLPWVVAATIGLVVLATTPFLALRVMGVRDWRCHAVAYGSLPVYASIEVGAISGALTLAVALMWRERHVVLAGGAMFAAKLFLWPLLLVELAQDRRRGTKLLACAAALVVVPWAFIGFADITRYPAMLADLSAAEARGSYSATGLAYALGASPRLGADVGIALALALTVMALRAARRGRRDAAYTLGIVAGLLASPIVWTHYLTLLLLPLAARAPRFTPLWLVMFLPWAGTTGWADGHLRNFIATWPCVAIIAVATLRPDLTARLTRPLKRMSLAGHGDLGGSRHR